MKLKSLRNSKCGSSSARGELFLGHKTVGLVIAFPSSQPLSRALAAGVWGQLLAGGTGRGVAAPFGAAPGTWPVPCAGASATGSRRGNANRAMDKQIPRRLKSFRLTHLQLKSIVPISRLLIKLLV